MITTRELEDALDQLSRVQRKIWPACLTREDELAAVAARLCAVPWSGATSTAAAIVRSAIAGLLYMVMVLCMYKTGLEILLTNYMCNYLFYSRGQAYFGRLFAGFQGY